MDSFWKIAIGAAIIWILFGGKGMLEKKQRQPTPEKPALSDTSLISARENGRSAGTDSLPVSSKTAARVPRPAPAYEINSLDYLQEISRSKLELDNVRVTYYLLANSTRCHVDSLPPCLQDRIRSARLDPRQFQYTYFLDRVLIAGSGILSWEGKEYFVRYDALRKHRWTSGKRRLENDYSCSSFAYKEKNGIDFIKENLLNQKVFTPLDQAPYPNGPTASGQQAKDWQTLAVNTYDFPLSVPDSDRRARLAGRMSKIGRRPPRPRAFVVLEFPNGKMYLTEASDTGSGVKSRTVDWRISNSSTDIAFFHSLGSRAKATCFVIDDAKVRFEEVFAQSVR